MDNLPRVVEEWRRVAPIRWDIESLDPACPTRRIEVACPVCQGLCRIGKLGETDYVGCSNFFAPNSQTRFWGCWNNAQSLAWCQGATPAALAQRYWALLPLEVYSTLVERSDGHRAYTALETLQCGSLAYVIRATDDLAARRDAVFVWWTN